MSELNFEAYLKSGKGQNQLFRANPNVVRRSLDCVAKVGGMRPVRNNRIQEGRRLNQSCAAR
jgi:hypothetical protein